MVLVDPFDRLGLALSFSFSFPLGLPGGAELLKHDTFVDLTGPEKLILLHLLQGILEGGPIRHQLTNLAPCIPLCPEKGSLRGRWLSTSNLWSIEAAIPFIKVTLAQIELLELWEGQHTHEKVVPENRVHPLQLPPAGRADTICLGAKYPISPFAQYLNCFFRKASLPWYSRRGLGVPVWEIQSFSMAILSHTASKLDLETPTEPHAAAPAVRPDWNMCFACSTAWKILIAVKFDPCWSNPFSPSLNFKSVGLCVRAKSAVVHRQARSSMVV